MFSGTVVSSTSTPLASMRRRTLSRRDAYCAREEGSSVASGAQSRMGSILAEILKSLSVQFSIQVDATGTGVNIDGIAPGYLQNAPAFEGVVVAEVAHALPPRSTYTPAVWPTVLTVPNMARILGEKVLTPANAAYRRVLSSPAVATLVVPGPDAQHRAAGLAAARRVLDRECRGAG